RHISSAGDVPSADIAVANVELLADYPSVIASNRARLSERRRECPRPSLLEMPAGPSASRTTRSRTQRHLYAGRRSFRAPVPATCTPPFQESFLRSLPLGSASENSKD